MQYKTIILGMLEQRPELYEQLRTSHQLLPALENSALELKSLHQAWKELLAQRKPDSDPAQISSEALELAIQALEDFLPSASPPTEDEILSLDGAMAFLRSHTPTA